MVNFISQKGFARASKDKHSEKSELGTTLRDRDEAKIAENE